MDFQHSIANSQYSIIKGIADVSKRGNHVLGLKPKKAMDFT
jgi:hypothetical protein